MKREMPDFDPTPGSLVCVKDNALAVKSIIGKFGVILNYEFAGLNNREPFGDIQDVIVLINGAKVRFNFRNFNGLLEVIQ